MGETIKTAENEKMTLKIVQDEDVESPREGENLGVMICWHRRYNLGDKHNFSEPRDFMVSLVEKYADEEVEEIDELTDDELMNIIADHIVILPLFLYDHSGITMKTSSFNDRWDSGQVGWIYASKKRFRDETGYTESELFNQGLAQEMLIGEVEDYDKFLTGDVYGFVLEDEFGDVKDSCWGFYGLEAIQEELKGYLGSEHHDLIEKLDFVS